MEPEHAEKADDGKRHHHADLMRIRLDEEVSALAMFVHDRKQEQIRSPGRRLESRRHRHSAIAGSGRGDAKKDYAGSKVFEANMTVPKRAFVGSNYRQI